MERPSPIADRRGRAESTDVNVSAKVRVPKTLKFRRYAAAASLVGMLGANWSLVAWAAVMPVIRVRRNAMIMSSMET